MEQPAYKSWSCIGSDRVWEGAEASDKPSNPIIEMFNTVAIWIIHVVVVIITLIGLHVSSVLKIFISAIQLASNTESWQLHCVKIMTTTSRCFSKYLHHHLDCSSIDKMKRYKNYCYNFPHLHINQFDVRWFALLLINWYNNVTVLTSLQLVISTSLGVRWLPRNRKG